MWRIRKSILILASALGLLSSSLKFTAPQKNPVASLEAVAGTLDRLPLHFIENKGQAGEGIAFHLHLRDANVYFSRESIVHQFYTEKKNAQDPTLEKERRVQVENMRLRFLGANPEVRVEGMEESGAKFSYLRGNDVNRWVRGAPAYNRLVYKELYPKIDLVVYGQPGRIKHEYRVRPGGNIGQIRLRYEGIRSVKVDGQGQLELEAQSRLLKEEAPVSYQTIKGRQVRIESAYVLENGHDVRFKVGPYCEGEELVIDPLLVYSTYLGGSNTNEFMRGDRGYGIAVDGSGNVYVTGETHSTDFPTTPGVFDSILNDGVTLETDAFVTKLNPTGSALVYSTFLGGMSNERGYDIAIDGSGNAYVTGSTGSGDFPYTNFYGTRGFGGLNDVFVVKLNPSGTALGYSVILTGAGSDTGHSIAVDGSGNAYVAGVTLLFGLVGSSQQFPTTSGAYRTTSNGGDFDAFVAKLGVSGTLVYSTFLGGNENDEGWGIDVDGSGNAYVTGFTESSNFPTTAGSYHPNPSSHTDCFISKFNAAGSALVYSTFLGGTSSDEGHAIAVDGSGCAIVTGFTSSNDFPTTTGAVDTGYHGFEDAFVTKLNAAGTNLVFSSFLGGYNIDIGYGIAVDEIGNIYVTGTTYSPDFPRTTGTFSWKSDYDAFVTKLNSNGSALILSTFLGGAADNRGYFGEDIGRDVGFDRYGNVYVTGYTSSTDFPTTAGAYDTSLNGYRDAFIAKLRAATFIKEDFVGTWANQGVNYRNSDTGAWVQMASPAAEVATGDIDGDGTDDIIGVWPLQGGVWIRNSNNGFWYRIGSPAAWISSGDMNGDGRKDFLGTWDGDGVYYMDIVNMAWTKIAPPATQIAAGDLDGDGKDDLVGIWSTSIWVKYSQTETWAIIASAADWIACGDMNGDGKDDLLGTWAGSGVFYRDSATGAWVMLASAASQVAAGDLDGDGKDDLIGVWPAQGGVWTEYSSTGEWANLTGSIPTWISCGYMRGGAARGVKNEPALLGEPPGGLAWGRESIREYKDFSRKGPGGFEFKSRQQKNLTPREEAPSRRERIPGPGDPGFKCTVENNLHPKQGMGEK